MVEIADTTDLKSVDHKDHAGAIPVGDTKQLTAIGRALILKRTIADKGYNTPCWLWSNIPDTNYGAMKIGGLKYDTHILSAQEWLPNFNSKLMTLHKCNIKRCFNPNHLYQGTSRDNVNDMITAKTQGQISRTHCKHGHEYTSENTKLYRGARLCVQCRKIRLKNKSRFYTK